VVVAVLGLGLIGGGFYVAHRAIYNLTSPTAATIPTFDGGDDVYNGAEQKINDFNQSVQQNQPASLHLSADEMNTLIARDASFAMLKDRLFLAATGDQANAQASMPLDAVPFGLFKGRFLNFDATCSFNFDAGTHTVQVTLRSLKLGDQVIPDGNLAPLQQECETFLNTELQKNPAFKNIADHAKTFEIKDGELVVETN
jgi:hypothetical protein